MGGQIQRDRLRQALRALARPAASSSSRSNTSPGLVTCPGPVEADSDWDSQLPPAAQLPAQATGLTHGLVVLLAHCCLLRLWVQRSSQ